MTQIYATASGVSSSAFQQPLYQNSQGTSPVSDFFETCPIQTITLEVGLAGSQQTDQTPLSSLPKNERADCYRRADRRDGEHLFAQHK